MALITEHNHDAFIKCLQSSILKLEEQNSRQTEFLPPVAELKENFAQLETLYSEYHATTNQLRILINQYNRIQKKTRVQLRVVQLKYRYPL